MAIEYLDVTGQSCPVPILLTKRALAEKPAGVQLVVKCTDPQAPEDFRRFSRRGGVVIQSIHEGNGFWEITLSKTARQELGK